MYTTHITPLPTSIRPSHVKMLCNAFQALAWHTHSTTSPRQSNPKPKPGIIKHAEQHSQIYLLQVPADVIRCPLQSIMTTEQNLRTCTWQCIAPTMSKAKYRGHVQRKALASLHAAMKEKPQRLAIPGSQGDQRGGLEILAPKIPQVIQLHRQASQHPAE
jgi:hypothetical protein